MKIQSLIALSVSTFAVMLLSGCGSTKSGDAGPTGAGASAGASASAVKTVFIPKSAGNPYFARMEIGFDRSKGSAGIEYSTQAPQAADATSQISVIKNQVQRGQQVLVISPNSPDALNEALDQAQAKGVVVITADADLVGNESHRSVGVLPVDFSTIGPSQVELLGSMIGYEGEIAILSATSDAPNQNAWIEGMKTALEDSKYAKMKLVDVVYGDDEPQKSSTEMEGLLVKHPNLRGVIAPTSVGLAAAAQVLTKQGNYPGGPKATGKGLVLTGLGTPNELKKAVKEGAVQKFQLWDPADIGDVAAFLASQLGQKKLELKAGLEFEIPGKGKFKIGEKNVVIAGALVTFDKENIDKYDY